MINCNSLSVDNKAVKHMTIDGKLVYSTDPNYSYSLYGLEDVTLSSFTTAQAAGSYTLPDGGTYTYDIHEVPKAVFWGMGNGNTNLFPVSPHVFARAAHYGSLDDEYVYLTNASKGETARVVPNEMPILADWAKANGFDASYVDSLHIGDIQMVYSSEEISSVIEDDDIPYIIPEIQFKGMFYRDDIKGLVGWCGTQLVNYEGRPQPIVFGGTLNGELAWSTPKVYRSFLPEEDYTTYIRSDEVGNTYLGTTGDSGKPVYFTVGGGKNIIVSHNHQIYKPGFGAVAPYVMAGPNYFKAYPLIKAYVESKGDTLKTL